MTVSVLGTDYEIIFRKAEEDPKFDGDTSGYCDPSIHKIVVLKCDENDETAMEDQESVMRQVLRHELVHAFAFESGLSFDCEWALNEEMTDWIAIQFPKMVKCFMECGALLKDSP